jgi:hypothetical protein
MPWKCPACQNPIRHSESQPTPRAGVTYRCPICRLELVADAEGETMTLAPMPTSETELEKKENDTVSRS